MPRQRQRAQLCAGSARSCALCRRWLQLYIERSAYNWKVVLAANSQLWRQPEAPEPVVSAS